MNRLQLDIFHQQLLLMRTSEEVVDLANGILTLRPTDPRDAVIEELDRAFASADDDTTYKEPIVARYSDTVSEVIAIVIPKKD